MSQIGKLPKGYISGIVKATEYHSHRVAIPSDRLPTPSRITVVNNDCLYEAERLIGEGKNVCVLNMASFKRPGGGVTRGSSAQEEDIFRRTTIAPALFQFSDIANEYGMERNPSDNYPLPLNWGAIYTPNVTIMKYGRDKQYMPVISSIAHPIGVVSVPALRQPPLIDGEMTEWAKKVTMDKIHQMLCIPRTHGHNALALGAFGCGAYKNPPQQMAALFKEMLSRNEYKYLYEDISFAILEDNNSFGKHNPRGNLVPFIKELA